MNTQIRWTNFLAAAQAERISGGCAGCANLARVGAPMQCNHHRTTAPDRMTQVLELVTAFAQQGESDPHALALDAVGA
jgi:hypothetical protein